MVDGGDSRQQIRRRHPSPKVQECKGNPNVRLDTPGARGKLETSLALSNSPLISGINGGSTIDDRNKFKQASWSGGGGYCALNSICNGLPESHALAEEDYREQHALGERCSLIVPYSMHRLERHVSQIWCEKIRW